MSVEETGAAGAVASLLEEFSGTFGRETVQDVYDDSRSRLGTLRLRGHGSLLAYRFARQRLRAAAVARGLVPRERPEVLLVCTHNAGRSQLAAALLAERSQGRVVVRSAGTEPADEVDPGVARLLAERDLPREDFPKPLTDEFVAAADVVVTMGCGDACPVVPGRRYLDWELPDPAGAGPEQVAQLHDELVRRVDALLAELLP